LKSVLSQWFITPPSPTESGVPEEKTDWNRIVPFVLLHLMCVLVFWVGWSYIAVITAILFYCVRMVSLSGFYHRYFSHRTYKTSRAGQFVFAVLGNSCSQKGPLWWAAHHRRHHVVSDTEEDVHSPVRHGFIWSHVGWIFAKKNFGTNLNAIQDFAKYPELRFLDRFDLLVPLIAAAMMFVFGAILGYVAPNLGTNGPQMFIWGFVVSTVVLFHATFTINSLAHMIGTHPFSTGEASRNNFFLALITFGEWHNNHHYFPAATRLGFYWWQLDITYYVLAVLAKARIIWGLKQVPPALLKSRS
jgi:stearoyl-CoA desaturase (delta-9 desaturase)